MKRMWRTISVVVMRKNIGWIEVIHGISIAENGHFVWFAKNHITGKRHL